jgi:cellulose synthase/poly-beta-1,6-N-acetylglucosamine synthase-like glycosyltransferase
MTVLVIIFLISVLLLVQSYIIYPLSILIISKIRPGKFKKSNSDLPPISILISAYNEEKVIEKTIRNFLLCDYDKDKIEFIIGSDNSSDNTNEIINKLSGEIPALKFFPFSERRGKANVLNDLVKHASSEILVFSDANTIYKKDALKELVRHYEDDSIGGVSGKLSLIEHSEASLSASQEKVYWDFETWLKEKEGQLGILIGANGGIYSIRKKYYNIIPSGYPIMDDFFVSLKVLEQGKYFIYTSEAVAEEYVAPSVDVEFKRKVRNNSIMMSTIKSIKGLLNPKFGLVAYALWSHKIIRWFSPVLLILLFLSNLFLIEFNLFFKVLFYLQVLFYITALTGFLMEKAGVYFKPVNLVFYFVMTNTAMLIGIFKFLLKKQTSFWQSTART